MSLSIGGYYYAGNLNQIQGNVQGHYGLSSPTLGLDLLFNGYRLWGKPRPEESFRVLGDDAFATALPFWYFSRRFYVLGLARYETSFNQRVDHRILTGVGVGYAPVRSRDYLLRIALLPAFEFASYDEAEFRIDVDHDGPERRMFRGAIVSNGWFRIPNSPVSFRYVTQVLPNLLDHRDWRVQLNARINVKIVKSLAFRATQIVTFDAATVASREPYDIRSTFGLAWSTSPVRP